MNSFCTILHLSDIHFGSVHNFSTKVSGNTSSSIGWVHPTLLHSLESRLEQLLKKDVPICPDLIVASGDFIFAKDGPSDRNAMFGYAADFLEDLLRLVNRLRPTDREKLTKNSVVFFPGNHDVSRKGPSDLSHEDFWNLLYKRFYRDFIDKKCPFHSQPPDRDNPNSPPPSIYAIGVDPEQTLAIVGIDSNEFQNENAKAFLQKAIADMRSQRGTEDVDFLLDNRWPGCVNERELDRLLTLTERSFPHAAIGVAFHHHLGANFRSIDDLDYQAILNTPQVLDTLGKHDVAFVLHGHKHIPRSTTLHHRCPRFPGGWEIPVIGAGSMCNPQKEGIQPKGVQPAFNIIQIPVPLTRPSYHINVKSQFADGGGVFNADKETREAVRVETKDVHHAMVAGLPPLDLPAGQANWKVLTEMDFLKKLRRVELLMHQEVDNYVARIANLTNQSKGFVWMTCCVTPRHLCDHIDHTRPALSAFKNAAQTRDVRRVFVLPLTEYKATAVDTKALKTFWKEAVDEVRMQVLCTRREWFPAEPDFSFMDTDFVIFGNGANIDDGGHVVAFLADDQFSIGHIAQATFGADAQAGELRNTLESFFRPEKQPEHIKRCFLKCKRWNDFPNLVNKYLFANKPPAVSVTRGLW